MKLSALQIIAFLIPIPILLTGYTATEPRSLFLMRLIGSILIVWILGIIDCQIESQNFLTEARARGETSFDPEWTNLASIVFGWIFASIVTGFALLIRFIWFKYVRNF